MVEILVILAEDRETLRTRLAAALLDAAAEHPELFGVLPPVSTQGFLPLADAALRVTHPEPEPMQSTTLHEVIIADTAAGLVGWDGGGDEYYGTWRGLPVRVVFSHSGNHTVVDLHVNGTRFPFEDKDRNEFVKQWSIARHKGVLLKVAEALGL